MEQETTVAHGTPVRWTANGGTHEGTVTTGPDADGYYAILTGSGATATLKRDRFELVGEQAAAEPDLTPEQAAALRDERVQQVAERLVTDAIMQVYTVVRQLAEADAGGVDLGREVADDLRLEAAMRVHNAATDLRARLTKQIADKQALPPRESVPEPAATAPAVPE